MKCNIIGDQMSRKYSSYIALVFLVLALRSDSECQQQFSLASSSVGSSSGVASGGSFSASYSVGIPAGGEVSSNLFWTSAGVGPIASVLRCPIWWVCGTAFYDENLNGIKDVGECGIAGRSITIMGPSDTITLTTDANGDFCRSCLPAGTYTICQELPDSTATCKWVTTTLCKTKEVIEPWRANIGSAYSCIDGRSIGFWSNKHGGALITDTDLSALRTLNLRNTNGSNFDPTTANQYQSWLTSAGASNMAYKLSEHLSALKLNLAHGMTGPAGNVDAGRDLTAMMEYANCLLDNPIGVCGGSFAGQNGSVTTGSSLLKTEQERLKNVIQQINTNGSFVQPSPCGLVAGPGKLNVDSLASSSLPMPTTFALGQNYPNPFNPTTVIRYQLPVSNRVTLKIYNVLGQEVKTLVDEVQDVGFKSVQWDASGIASGVYFYRIQAGTFVASKKLLLLK